MRRDYDHIASGHNGIRMDAVNMATALGKKDGERSRLSLNTANELMAGYYS